MPGHLLPLVLIHGYPLSHKMWFGVIAALGNGVRCIAPDLRGFGKAPPPEGEPSLETMAADILAQLKRDNIERAVFAGMSMGGYVALAIAEMAPKKVAGLALINSQPFADTDEARAARRELIKKIRAEGPGAAARAIIPRMFAPNHSDNPDFQHFVTEGADAAGGEGLCWTLEALARRPDRSNIISQASCPVLVFHTPDDRIIPLEKARQAAALNPEAHLVTVMKGGHAAAIEAPDEVASTLRKFLEICGRPKTQV